MNADKKTEIGNFLFLSIDITKLGRADISLNQNLMPLVYLKKPHIEMITDLGFLYV